MTSQRQDSDGELSLVNTAGETSWLVRTLPALPRPLTPLIGREQVVQDVLGVLDRARLVTLTGPGGVGKTRVALETAHGVARSNRARVVFIPMEAARTPKEILPTILRTMGMREGGENDLLAALRTVTFHGPLLLVLDNLEQISGAGAIVAEMLAGVSNLSVLVTSRVILSVAGEQRIVVTPLEVPGPGDEMGVGTGQLDAVRLFMARARAAGAGGMKPGDVEIVGRICQQVDGLPLLLELAAARLTHLSLADLERRLVDQLRTLASDVAVSAERHQTMKATIGWSYALLTAEEQRTLRVVSVFEGDFTLEAAVEVIGSTRISDPDGGCEAERLHDQVTDQIRALVDASLLAVAWRDSGITRYRLLETIRVFALAELRERGEYDGARDRHAKWYLGLARRLEVVLFSPNAAQRTRQLEVDNDNERAAIAWLRERNDRGRMAELTAALAYSWWLRGAWRSARPLLAAVWDDDAARQALPARDQVSLGMALGLILVSQGAPEADWRPILTQCVELGRDADRPRVRIAALIAMGWASAETSAVPEGKRHLLRALHLTRELDPGPEALSLVGVVLNNLGEVCRMLGAVEEAARHLSDAQVVLAQSGDAGALAYNLVDRAHVARDTGEAREAWRLLQTAVSDRSMWSDHRYIVSCLEGMTTIAASLGAMEIAGRLFGAYTIACQVTGLQMINLQDATSLSAAVWAARRQLGAEEWDRILAEGTALAPTEILAIELPGVSDDQVGPLSEGPVARTAPTSLGAGQFAGPGGTLTKREVDVLRLLLAGLSNRKIAERLFVSPRTVESHLVRIFGKLDVTSRTGAVAQASRMGFVAAGPPG